MERFTNLDIFEALAQIMRQNTAFFQSDFDIDKKIIREAANQATPADKTLLWFSRPCGTACFRERDVFLKETRQHNTWRFYREQTSDRILAYAVEPIGIKGDTIMGNLYQLDYARHYERVQTQSVPADSAILTYEYGERRQETKHIPYSGRDPQLGKLLNFEVQPNDPHDLRMVLQAEQKARENLPLGNFKEHIKSLHEGLIEAEARRIVEQMKRQEAPNSPDHSHFMAQISAAFEQLASAKDMNRLFSMLPYSSAHFSMIQENQPPYVLIEKSENRNKDIRTSIRRQLTSGRTKPQREQSAKTRQKAQGLEVD